MSVNPNTGCDAWKDNEAEYEHEERVVNKWSNRRYEQPGTNDLVEETALWTTKVVIKYEPVKSALEPGIAGKLLHNSTDPILANR